MQNGFNCKAIDLWMKSFKSGQESNHGSSLKYEESPKWPQNTGNIGTTRSKQISILESVTSSKKLKVESARSIHENLIK